MTEVSDNLVPSVKAATEVVLAAFAFLMGRICKWLECVTAFWVVYRVAAALKVLRQSIFLTFSAQHDHIHSI